MKRWIIFGSFLLWVACSGLVMAKENDCSEYPVMPRHTEGEPRKYLVDEHRLHYQFHHVLSEEERRQFLDKNPDLDHKKPILIRWRCTDTSEREVFCQSLITACAQAAEHTKERFCSYTLSKRCATEMQKK